MNMNSFYASCEAPLTDEASARFCAVETSPRTTSATFVRLQVFFQAEDGIRDGHVTGVQTCALPICGAARLAPAGPAGHARPPQRGAPRPQGLQEHKPRTGVRCAGRTERGSDAVRRTNTPGSSRGCTDCGESSVSPKSPATAPPNSSPSSEGHRRSFQSSPESSLMCATPHIKVASKTCSEKMLETSIPLYYLAFRDRN